MNHAQSTTMIDLMFQVEKAEADRFAVVPQLEFRLRIAQVDPEDEPIQIHSLALRCQVRIEPNERRYVAEERERLVDLFGEPERWGQTLKPMLWTHANVVVPPFRGETLVDLPVPCSYDFNLAATKFFYALEDGVVPLCLLFSGTIFFEAEGQGLQVAQIPWEKETTYRLPIKVWQDMMDIYYPNCAAIYLRRDIFERLYHYKRRHGLLTWEHTLERLLEQNA